MTTAAMRHAELIRKLAEFYILLVQLGSIEESSVHIPSSDTPAPIRRAAALEAGYSRDVVDLLEQLPYVSKDPNDWHPEFLPSIEPIDFTKCEDADAFKIWREFDDGREHEDEDGNEDLIPASLLKLSEHHLYGTTLLYDTQSRLLIDWEPNKNHKNAIGHAHVPAKPPGEVLGPWIEGFRSFKYMHTPGANLWDAGHSVYGPPEPPQHYPPDQKTHWWAARAVEQALYRIKDIYLECGWDMTSQTQDNFDRARFIEMRERYMDEVVRPLEDKTEEARQTWHRDEL